MTSEPEKPEDMSYVSSFYEAYWRLVYAEGFTPALEEVYAEMPPEAREAAQARLLQYYPEPHFSLKKKTLAIFGEDGNPPYIQIDKSGAIRLHERAFNELMKNLERVE